MFLPATGAASRTQPNRDPDLCLESVLNTEPRGWELSESPPDVVRDEKQVYFWLNNGPQFKSSSFVYEIRCVLKKKKEKNPSVAFWNVSSWPEKRSLPAPVKRNIFLYISVHLHPVLRLWISLILSICYNRLVFNLFCNISKIANFLANDIIKSLKTLW